MPQATTTTPKNQPRKRKGLEYKRFRYSKRIKHPGPALSSSWKLFKKALGILKRNWRLFAGIILIYGVLMIIFVRGLGATSNIGELKSILGDTFGDRANQFSTGAALLGILLSSAGNTSNQVASTYQSILLVVASLSVVWVLRQLHSNPAPKKLKIKDPFYKGMYPLVPFLLVILFMSLQLIPLIIGATFYSFIVNNGLAVSMLEKLTWGMIFFLLALWSLYMWASSIMALYIVTLPNMTPVKALKTARKLVRYRRWTVLRKLIMLPIILIVLVALILFPLVLWLTPAAEWVLFLLGLITLPLIHSYLYSLYRELL